MTRSINKSVFTFIFLFLTIQTLFSQDYTKLSDAVKANSEYAITLDLSGPDSDTLSDEVFKLKKVYRLILKGGKGKNLPQQLAKLPNVFFLELIDYEISEKELDYLYHCNQLETFYLKNVRFSSAINWNLPCFSKLRNLTIDSCSVNIVQEALFSLPKLQNLQLKNMSLKKIPDSISKAQQLYHLSLVNVNVTKFPAGIATLTQLQELDLSGNQLKKVPDVIYELNMLTSLSLNDNHLTRFDGSLKCVKTLERLNLSTNELQQFPAAINGASKLFALDVSNNNIGELPEWIGFLSSLNSLSVQKNRLKKLTESVCDLSKSFLTLDVSANQLNTLSDCILKKGLINFKYEHNLFSEEELKRIEANLVIKEYRAMTNDNMDGMAGDLKNEGWFSDPTTKKDYNPSEGEANTIVSKAPEKYEFIEQKFKKEYTYYIVQKAIYKYYNEGIGYADKDKNILLPPIFHFLEGWYTSESNNMILKVIGQDNKHGIYDLTKKKWVVPLQYSSIRRVDNESNYLIVKDNDDKSGLITVSEIILPTEYTYIQTYYVADKNQSLLLCFKNSKSGIFDLNQKKFIIPLDYEAIEAVHNSNFFKVRKDSLYNYLNLSNQPVFDEWFSSIEKTNDPNSVFVKKNGLWKLIDMQGEKILPYDFTELNKNKWSTTTEKKCGLIKGGKVVLPFVYEIAPKSYYAALIPAKKEHKYGFLHTKNDTLKEFLPFDFDTLIEITSNYFIAKKNGLYALFRAKEKNLDTLCDFQYDTISFIAEQKNRFFFQVKKQHTEILIDDTGKIIIDGDFTTFKALFQPSLLVPSVVFKGLNIKGKWQLVNSEGKIFPGAFDEISTLDGSLVLFKNGEKSGIYSLTKEKIIFQENFDVFFAKDKVYYGFKGKEILKYEINESGNTDGSDFSSRNLQYGSSKSGNISSVFVIDTLKNGCFIFSLTDDKYSQKMGLMDKKGEIILPPLFAIIYQDELFKELSQMDLISVHFEYKNLIYDTRKNKWRSNILGFVDQERTMCYTNNEKGYGISTIKGKVILEDYHKITPLKMDPTKAVVQKNGLKAFYDLKSEKFLTEFIYEEAKEIVTGKTIVVKDKNTFYLLDSTLEILGNTKYEILYGSELSDCLLAKKDNKWGVINSRGEIVLPFEYTSTSRNFWFKNASGKYGCLSRDGKITIPFNYESLYNSVDYTNTIALSEGKYFIVNTQLRQVSEGYDTITLASSSGFLVKNEGKYGYRSTDQILVKPEFDTIIYKIINSDNFFITRKGNTYLYYKQKQIQLQSEKNYSDLKFVPSNNDNGRQWFLKYKMTGTKYGLMSTDVFHLTVELFDDIEKVYGNYAVVKNNGKYGIYNFESHKLEVECLHDQIIFGENERFYLFDGTKVTSVNLVGNTILMEVLN